MTVTELQHQVKEYNAQTNSNLNMVFVSFKHDFILHCRHTAKGFLLHPTV